MLWIKVTQRLQVLRLYMIREGLDRKKWGLGRKFKTEQLKIFLSIYEYWRDENVSKTKRGCLVSRVTVWKPIIMHTCAVSKRLAWRKLGFPSAPLGRSLLWSLGFNAFFLLCHWLMLQSQPIYLLTVAPITSYRLTTVNHPSRKIRFMVKGLKESRSFEKVWMNDESKSSLRLVRYVLSS